MNGINNVPAHVRGHVNVMWYALKGAYGIVPIVAGLDKFFNILVEWPLYMRIWAPQLPVDVTTYMYAVGIIEILAGLIVLSNYTRLGAYIVMIWLLLIASSLIAQGIHYDVAVRDIVMAVGAFCLAQVDVVRKKLG